MCTASYQREVACGLPPRGAPTVTSLAWAPRGLCIVRAMKRWGVVPLVAALAACSASPSSTPVDGGNDLGAVDAPADATTTPDAPPRAYPMPSAANAVAQTDARWEGQYRFLYDTWGTEVLGDWPTTDFMLGLLRDEPSVFGPQFSNFGFIPDPDDDLPFGLKRGITDRTVVHETCAMCHVGRLPDGRVWLGLPNTSLDVGRFRVEVNRRWVAAGHPSFLTPLAARKALALGPGRFNAESGDYPEVVPADFPPYFTLGRRTALNYMGTGRNVRTEAHFAIFSFGAGSPNDTTARVPFPEPERVESFLAFFGTLDAPPPPAGDAARIAAGRAVFERARCGTCHHVGQIEMDGVTALDRSAAGRERIPGDDPMFPRGTIRTNAQHRVLQDGDAPSDGGTVADGGVDMGLADLIQFILTRRLSVQQTDGYRVGDLRGLAYTAPYLHNGSVPTLDALLRARAQRPTTFARGAFTVDTTATGNGNEGHEFGADLDDTDRAALVAYLQSL